MSVSHEAVRSAVEEAGVLLRADGADLRLLHFDAERGTVQVEVDISGSNCAECIIPPDLLAVTLTDAINRALGTPVMVIVEDSRT